MARYRGSRGLPSDQADRPGPWGLLLHALRGLGALRLPRDRKAAVLAVATVAALVAGSIAYGIGASSDVPRLADIGAWLGSEKQDTVVHANGLTGKVDGKVQLTGSTGHPLKIVQDGATVLVVDEVTGRISRIDPAELSVAQQQTFGATGLDVVAGHGLSFVVDASHGTVQRIDPTTLATIGRPIAVAPSVGQAAVDGRGTLWVPVPSRGEVVPVRAAGRSGPVAGTAIKVGAPGDPLIVTMAAGVPVVTDPAVPATVTVGDSGVTRQVNLPSALRSRASGAVLAPAGTEGAVVPVLDSGTDTMSLIDTGTGAVTTVRVGSTGDRFGPPQILGSRVYVPDESTGTLIVYDRDAGQFDNQITVTGHRSTLDAYVQDGVLWVNDQDSAAAVSIDQTTGVHYIGKYGTGVPGQRRNGPQATPGQPRSGGGAGGTGQGGTSGGGPLPPPPTVGTSPSPTPKRVPTPSAAPPQAPGTVTATSGQGSITITFSPSSGGAPKGYRLADVPPGLTVQPSEVPPSGPFTFVVTGGTCGTEYAFAVQALYQGGSVSSQKSVPTLSCESPTAPQQLTYSTASHQVSLRWTPPASSGGGQVSYQVQWNGGQSGRLGGTSYTARGLTNFQTYGFQVAAVNAAGSSSPAAATSVALDGPSHTYQLHNNQSLPLNVRAAPTQNSASVHQFGAGQTPPVTVLCQTSGGRYTDQVDGYSSNIWDKVSGFGPSAYIGDVYVATPQSDQGHFTTFSDPPLWPCQ